MRFLIAMVFVVSPAVAQIHVGLKAGVPLTDITRTTSTATVLGNLPSRWTLDPMIELDLAFGFGVEVNALYRRVGYEVLSQSGPPSEENDVFRDGLWDFPVIAKYKFSGAVARPFVGAGWTYRNLNELLNFSSSSHGLVLAGGIRIETLGLNISPEIRYTRWANNAVEPGFRTNLNQAEILVGITF